MEGDKHIETVHLPAKMHKYAPDASEIRLLVTMEEASFAHCTLPPQKTSLTGMHQNIKEIWYCIQGQGQMWRKGQKDEAQVDVSPGVCLTIPQQTHFQFRNTGCEPLCFIIATIPPWPGDQEWIRVADHWLI